MPEAPGRYRLGLPAWAFPGWQGRYWTGRPSPLACYAQIFDAVEGNTTFYRVPDRRSVNAWRAAVAGTPLKFCFKLPRTVTHERTPDQGDLTAFLRNIAVLEHHLGPVLVQFPARSGSDSAARMTDLLERIPAELSWVLEVRHPEFFTTPALIDAVLAQRSGSRVTMDTRALYGGDRQHPEVASALHEKPALPVLPETQGAALFLRLVLHPDPQYNHAVLEEWADRVAGCLRRGDDAWVLIHCPNNLHCPAFARDFHRRLKARPGMAGIDALPDWPLPQQATLL